MPLYFNTSKNNRITVEDKPLGHGGEGLVHKILSPSSYTKFCVKLYYKPQEHNREQKINFMVNNPPSNLSSSSYLVCWPEELVYLKRSFAGFVMPLAFNKSIELYELSTLNINPNLPNVWHKYDRNSRIGIESRLKLCVNIAIAIHNIHSLNKYVMVDIKPKNMLITPDGKVSMTDLDSVQIADNKKLIFPALVSTPEYTPPEGVNLNVSKNYIPVSWDRFAISVAFYEILFGLHPFAASASGPYENMNTIVEKIKNGLFVHGSKSKHITNSPKLHDNFQLIPKSLQRLFLKAFDNNPDSRPSIEEWGSLIHKEINSSPKIQSKIKPAGKKTPKPSPAPPKPHPRPTPIPTPKVQPQTSGFKEALLSIIGAIGWFFYGCFIGTVAPIPGALIGGICGLIIGGFAGSLNGNEEQGIHLGSIGGMIIGGLISHIKISKKKGFRPENGKSSFFYDRFNYWDIN